MKQASRILDRAINALCVLKFYFKNYNLNIVELSLKIKKIDYFVLVFPSFSVL